MIFFDKGKQVMKIDKYLLCTASRFFAPMLDGPSIVSTQPASNISTMLTTPEGKSNTLHPHS
jgi:hypothetical protein